MDNFSCSIRNIEFLTVVRSRCAGCGTAWCTCGKVGGVVANPRLQPIRSKYTKYSKREKAENGVSVLKHSESCESALNSIK
jgi:hypothetical protein